MAIDFSYWHFTNTSDSFDGSSRTNSSANP